MPTLLASLLLRRSGPAKQSSPDEGRDGGPAELDALAWPAPTFPADCHASLAMATPAKNSGNKQTNKQTNKQADSVNFCLTPGPSPKSERGAYSRNVRLYFQKERTLLLHLNHKSYELPHPSLFPGEGIGMGQY